MSLSAVIGYLIIWGVIGALLLSLFVLFVFRSGIVYTTRNEAGLLKENIPLTGYLSSTGFLVLIVYFPAGVKLFQPLPTRICTWLQ